MKRFFRFSLVLILMLTFLSSFPASFAEETGEENTVTYIEPRYASDAIPWDSAHPELLDPDMLLAKSAILIEADSGDVLFEKNADEIMYPASTTKILTAYIALQMADLKNDTVTVSQEAVSSVPPTYTKIPLSSGEEINMLDLITATMIKSGNDGANAIAEFMSGSTESFAILMNNIAYMLGCSSLTHFSNPSGIQDENHYTTARDMAVIAQAAMKNDTFASIVKKISYDLPATNMHPQRNVIGKTSILDSESSSFYPYATGIKTGFTNAAGYCFVGSAEKGGVSLISVVLYTSDNGRWSDTRRLMEYGFTQIESITPESLYAESPRVIDIAGFDVSDSRHGELVLGIRALDPDKDMTVVGRKSTIDMLRENFSQISTIEWTKEFRAPIHIGDVMGILTFYSEGKGRAQYELVATRSVAARENAPPTLEQIVAYTQEDSNPLPRFTGDLLVPPTIGLFSLILLVRWRKRVRKVRPKLPGNLLSPKKRLMR